MLPTIITGVDIGTTTTTAVIGEIKDNGQVEIIGIGNTLSNGIRRGSVVNIDAVMQSVIKSLELAEQMAGQEVEDVLLSIGGHHVEGVNSHGVVPISAKGKQVGKEISQADVDNVMHAASAVAFPIDREVLHRLPQKFTIDEHHGIDRPIGMIGVRLEADIHIITCSVSTAQNMIKAVNRSGFRVQQLLYSGVAAADVVLTGDERELGVLLIDLGGGTTSATIFKEDAPYYTSAIPIGGIEITTDLSIVLKTPFDVAETLKCEHGSCQDFISESSEPVLIPGVGGRPPLAVERKEVIEIIKPRVIEILTLIKDKIQNQDQGLIPFIGGGVVLIGGGALLTGIAEIAQDVFGIGVRIGQPGNYGGTVNKYRFTNYSTAVGIVCMASKALAKNIKNKKITHNEHNVSFTLKKWLRNFFE